MRAVGTIFTGLCFGLELVSVSSVAAAADEYRRPQMTIPRAPAPPTIDGAIADAEWDGASSFNLLQTANRQLAARQTRFWAMWDAQNLYIAMRSPLRPGERLIQAHRDGGHDNPDVVYDDSYEIWIDAGTLSPEGNQPVFFQYLGNFAGARLDVMFEPAVGNSRPSWNSNWKPVNRLSADGKAWEMEIAIPFASLNRKSPFADGSELKVLLARNFKREWEQNSLSGTGSFSVPDTYALWTLSIAAPAIQVLDVADPSRQSLGLRYRASTPLTWSITNSEGLNRQGNAAVLDDLSLDKPGDGTYRLRLTDQSGKLVYLDWSAKRRFGGMESAKKTLDDRGDVASLNLLLNPVADYLRITGDFINYDRRARIADAMATVSDSAGRAITSGRLTLDDLAYMKGVLHLPNLAPGQYKAALVCRDASGQTVLERQSPFVKKDMAKEFSWWKTTHGNSEKVLAPWTAVTYSDRQLGVWGRTMQVGAAGLPAQVTTQGRRLLRSPIALQLEPSDGPDTLVSPGELTTVIQSDHRVVLESTGTLSALDIASLVTVEYDGMYKVRLTLTPHRKTAVQSLKMIVPFTAAADRYHASGEGIRTGYAYGSIPAKPTGRLFGSDGIDGQPMVMGSFVPFVWVGNNEGGLSWYADSDEGWVPSTKVPAFELRRDRADGVDLVFNLIGEPVTLDQPRTITFAFQASPVKPLFKGWRMDSWWCGDTFQDYSCVEPKGGLLIWTSIPFTLDTAKCRQMVQARHAGPALGFKHYRSNAVPYFENNVMGGRFAPEVGYFGEQWKTSVSGALCYDNTLSDFVVHHLAEWVKSCDIDGWYVDNVRPVACANIEAGRGYRLADGRIQPTYQIFDQRTFWLRVRAAFAEQGKHNKLVLHMTNNMVLPWIGAADIAYDGEDRVLYPEMGKDFIDVWPLDRLRLACGGPWGTVFNFMNEYQGNWKPDAMRRAMRAYTGLVGLHDALPSGNANGLNNDFWAGRERFGIAADDVTFLPYWQNETTASSSLILVSAWRRPSKVLLLIVNTGETADATVAVDYLRFGLSPEMRATDAETGQSINITGQTLRLSIPRHDYRQIILENP